MLGKRTRTERPVPGRKDGNKVAQKCSEEETRQLVDSNEGFPWAESEWLVKSGSEITARTKKGKVKER